MENDPHKRIVQERELIASGNRMRDAMREHDAAIKAYAKAFQAFYEPLAPEVEK